ncbi:MAG: FAD-dependent oxidoreductase [Burkholderiaceae bacterium]
MSAIDLKHKSYAIVGAGLLGRLLAVKLVQAGAKVELFDQGSPAAEHSAARVAASMLAPLAESAITAANVVQMGLYSLARWPSILAKLTEPVFFQQAGTLILWHRQDAAEAKRFAAKLNHNCQVNTALSTPQKLAQDDIHTLEPSLGNRFQHGLFLPNEGQLDNRQLLTALAEELKRLKVICHWHQSIEPHELIPNHYAGIIDCRGLGAKAAWASSSNENNPLRGVRGEVVRLHAPEVKLSRPIRFIHPRYPIYIAPKENDIYVIGATEIESEDLSPASLRSTMELLSAAYTVHSGFAEARILETLTQCRPTLKNNLPAIRMTEKGVMEINGLYRHGFMIAPAIVDCAIELLESMSTASADNASSTLAEQLQLSVTQSRALCAL